MDKIKQRIAIGNACGWTELKNTTPCRGNLLPRILGRHRLESGFRILPDYLNDLNAMHEAEDCLPDAYDRYEHFLKEKLGGEWGYATAAQRAEAFLRTINKWED